MSEKRFSETERNCYYTSLVFDNHIKEELGTSKVVVLLNELYDENERLRKDVENLQEVVAELGATLLMNGFEIKINGENLSELIDDE